MQHQHPALRQQVKEPGGLQDHPGGELVPVALGEGQLRYVSRPAGEGEVAAAVALQQAEALPLPPAEKAFLMGGVLRRHRALVGEGHPDLPLPRGALRPEGLAELRGRPFGLAAESQGQAAEAVILTVHK